MKIRTGNVGTFKLSMFNKFKVLYSGMPTNQTFALCPIVENATLTGEANFAPVVYYSVESKIIWLLGEKFKIEAIDANFISIELIKT